jgi:hypothetical protein
MQIASINAAPVPVEGGTRQSLTTANALGLLARLAPRRPTRSLLKRADRSPRPGLDGRGRHSR